MYRLSGIGARTVLALLLCLQAAVTSAAIWWDVAPSPKGLTGVSNTPIYYRALSADEDALRQALAAAPLEYTSSQGAVINLPMPNGSMQRFEVENSPIMAPELAARYPQIKTYRVKGIDDPTATGRLDMTPEGFHGMITNSSDMVYIEPRGPSAYRSFTRQAYAMAHKTLANEQTDPYCLLDQELETAARAVEDIALRIDGQRRVYRLAVAATGEYTLYHGGTVSQALSAIVTAINRVNQIYGRDVAVQFVLVSNNDSIIYTDPASDPYTNDDGLAMLDQNQTTLDREIGSANYDIGHVFSTLGGGIAAVGSTCTDNQKAKGVTGRQDPEDDIFYIDLVAHEIGHQLSATHSFNGTTDNCSGANRIAASAVEPGSGSTIMAYAGICGAENLQLTSDASFHAKSLEQIVTFTNSEGACGTTELIGNTAPDVDAGIDRVIPYCTPFVLSGTATDSDLADSLSYQWDEMDTGIETDDTTFGQDLGSNPLFRSYVPTEQSERNFPRMSAVVNGTIYKGEALPAFSRTMIFRLTARDGNGGVNEDDVMISVDDTLGPFEINGGVLNGGGSFLPESQQTIQWSTADTELSCPRVSISLLAFNSTGTTYCDARDDSALDLGSDFPNIGNATLTLPNLSITKGRIKVACANNIYFSLSEADIRVNGTTAVTTTCRGTDRIQEDGFGDLVEACKNQSGILSSADWDGGGGALFILPILIGLGAASRAWNRRARA